MKNKVSKVIFIAAACLLFIAAGILVYQSFRPSPVTEPQPTATVTPVPTPVSTPTPSPEETPEPEETPQQEVSKLPTDKLFITVKRQGYTDNAMLIVIPRLNYQKEVGDGTSEATLKIGPGLYDYAQLPNESFHNTSIAAHRRKSDLYYVDEMTTDDYFYLIYEDFIYRYLYEQTYIVEPSDWSPIYHKGYSMLTLTTCTPIGIADHRMIVTATLDAVFAYEEDFIFFSNANELAEVEADAEVPSDG